MKGVEPRKILRSGGLRSFFENQGQRKSRSGIRCDRRCGLEIANLYDNPPHAHQVSALVGSTPGSGWSLHVDEATLGNNSGRIIRFGSLTKFVVPVRGVHYSGKRDIVAFRHLVDLKWYLRIVAEVLTTDTHR